MAYGTFASMIEEAGMMMMIGIAVFMGGMASATGVIALTVAPQWRRIARLAMGHVEQPFAPLTALAHAERRIAVRRWSATSAPAQRWRAAA